MIHTRKPRVGIIGMGHFIYWPQFDGLLEELKQKQVDFAGFFSDNVEVIDLGFVDDVDSSMIALKRAKTEDLDALFIIMATYITSQTVFPFAKYLDIPQILVGIQPLDRLDYSKTTPTCSSATTTSAPCRSSPACISASVRRSPSI